VDVSTAWNIAFSMCGNITDILAVWIIIKASEKSLKAVSEFIRTAESKFQGNDCQATATTAAELTHMYPNGLTTTMIDEEG
jgi:hypothetical protein